MARKSVFFVCMNSSSHKKIEYDFRGVKQESHINSERLAKVFSAEISVKPYNVTNKPLTTICGNIHH